jgi:asparagine synthase (glutamine-hydrolysing)
MCSILFSSRNIDNLDFVNERIQKRGPDYTGLYKHKNYSFVHNLLSITGEFTKQPFKENEIVCMFNGQIYNYKDFGNYESDGECLIPLYEKYGDEFVKKLDGEFVILLADFKNDILLVSTDIFSTKPLYMAADDVDDFGFSSYASPLQRMDFKNIYKIPANKTYIFKLSKLELIKELSVIDFDLNQHKDNFDDWNKAFSNSMTKRATNIREHLYLGLSSGYDSGVIACELFNRKIPYKVYTVAGREHPDILNDRHNIIKEFAEVETLDIREDRERCRQHIHNNIDPFRFNIYTTDKSKYDRYFNANLHDDYGAIGLTYICEHAKKDNRKIYLSGQGADEIFADYGHAGESKGRHSETGGVFPEDLSSIFPWPNFFESSQEAFLVKEEYIAGAFGLETRYPFLDRDVVQEFLWLKPELKNKHYKSVLHNYLVENSFPFEENTKRGFSV